MIAIFVVLTAMSFAVMGALRSWHPAWWSHRWVRWGSAAIVLSAVTGMVFRNVGAGRWFPSYRSPGLTIAGAVLAGGGTVLLLGLMLSLPAAAVARRVLFRLFDRASLPPTEPVTPTALERAAAPEPTAEVAPTAPPGSASSPAPLPALGPDPSLGRRALLEAAVASLPVAALGAGGAGIVGAFRPTSVVGRPMRYRDLPEDLVGLRILQLTDLHLGAFLDPEGLAELVARGRDARPDLVVLTGDISDHLPWLPGAIREIETLAPRLGIFAVMGNHEHYRGAEEVRRAYAASRIQLLDDTHRSLEVGRERLVVLGVDDPSGWAHRDDHYARHADRALNGAPSDGFRLALCHRPSGFRALAARDVHLTLSGHTHGAQLGDGERSLLEGAAPDAYLWGRYALGERQLYTSSGGGHWFAFRLDCPTESPLITLERA